MFLPMRAEKKVSYTTTNSYTTVNSYSEKTKNIWLVFHGLGYLSRFFAKYFSELTAEENFIIIPQAPSKYYLGNTFKHVGASWLTKENTKEETANVLAYVDAVVEAEIPENPAKLIILGYSQGVSIATRWMSSRNIICDHLVLHSGGIPVELEPSHFDYLPKTTEVTYLYGNKDQYITEARTTEEQLKGNKLFGDRIKVLEFEGIHEVYVPFLLDLSEK